MYSELVVQHTIATLLGMILVVLLYEAFRRPR